MKTNITTFFSTVKKKHNEFGAKHLTRIDRNTMNSTHNDFHPKYISELVIIRENDSF